MRVNIGPYKNWIGPYQIADMIPFVSEDTRRIIGERLADSWFNDLCQWIDRKKKRKIDIRIDRYDTWNMDHTLALIALPMLKQLRETKIGAPFVDDEDVPEELRKTSAPPTENEWDTDANHFKRWDWALDEMIFAFENLNDDDWEDQFHKNGFDKEGFMEYNERINNGLRLFGKYYRGLWD